MELIKISLGDYPRYEELLLERDRCIKEGGIYRSHYMNRFGKMIIELFRLKIECIEYKKKMAACLRYLNRGEKPDISVIEETVQGDMKDYYERLRDLTEEHLASLKSVGMSEEEVLRVKQIYHEIAKLIHPDINPRTGESEELLDLWNRVCIAYRCNHLKEIEELKILVLKFLSDNGEEHGEVYIENIGEKIAALEEEIEAIKNSDPYRYKYLLEDEKLCEEKEAELENEINEYKDYRVKLIDEFDKLMGG